MPLLLPILLILAGAATAAAQSVVGTVVEEGTLRPLPGVFVQLFDDDGDRQFAVLSDEAGRFSLRAAAPGRYRVRAELIGYAPSESEALTLAAGPATELVLEVPIRAVSLDAIEVEAGARCRRHPGAGAATARLWEEARKALDVAQWGEATRALRFRVVQHRRNLDARTLRVTAQEEHARSGLYDRSPYRSVSAARLHGRGYVQADSLGSYDYFAPDAAVLLSETFLDDHCFRVTPPSGGDDGLVGLGFEPIPERDLPDIEGVLWLDRATAELRHLDFQYRNLPFEHGDWSRVGGRVHFDRLATGMWVVRRWHIRMPLEAERTGGFAGGPAELTLRSLVEVGADVRDVRTPSGDVVARATGATLFGSVINGTTGRPLAGATIEVLATGRTTAAADDGAFRVTGLSSGTFGVRVTHPDLEAMGLGPQERDVELELGEATRLRVEVETSAAVALEICRGAGWEPHSSSAAVFLHGIVKDAWGQAVPHGMVRIQGLPPGAPSRLMADSAGMFRTCFDPAGDPVQVSAAYPDDGFERSDGAIEVAVASAGFVRVDPRVPEPPSATGRMSARVRSSWSNELRGTVLDGDSRAPVPGVMLTLRAEEGTVAATAVTDKAGRFRFPHPQLGERYNLEAEHIGYRTTQGAIEFRPAEQLDVELILTARAVDLDPILVTDRRRGFLADMGFYERMESRAGGVFIDREEIDRRMPTRVTDLLQGRSGLAVARLGSGFDVRVVGTTRLGGGDCQPSVWIDGVLVRDGGAPRVTQFSHGPKVYSDLLSDLIDPAQLEGMEVYTGPAGLPLQYGGSNAACGVVVLWTRR